MNINTSPYAPAWRQALPLLIALIGWLLFWYWETASAMVAIWARSDTYAHAFIVPPITLWLIWRQRAAFTRLERDGSLAKIRARWGHGEK